MCIFVSGIEVDFKERLSALVSPYAQISEKQLALLERHYTILTAWNQKLNLTRITSIDDAVKLHYGESLFLGTVLPSGPLKIADVGSGAGFPGFLIAVMRPECSVDLIESHARKAVFLREACRGVSNLRILGERAEDVRGSYDWVVSRAVAMEDVMRLGLAPDVALLRSSGDVEVPFNPGHFIQMFHVKH